MKSFLSTVLVSLGAGIIIEELSEKKNERLVINSEIEIDKNALSAKAVEFLAENQDFLALLSANKGEKGEQGEKGEKGDSANTDSFVSLQDDQEIDGVKRIIKYLLFHDFYDNFQDFDLALINVGGSLMVLRSDTQATLFILGKEGSFVVPKHESATGNIENGGNTNTSGNISAGGNLNVSGVANIAKGLNVQKDTLLNGMLMLNSDKLVDTASWILGLNSNGQVSKIQTSWSDASRPNNPFLGQSGFNTTANAREYWNGGAWVQY